MKFVRGAQMIFEEAFVGEVDESRIVAEEHKRRWVLSRLRCERNAQTPLSAERWLVHRKRLLDHAIQLASRKAKAALVEAAHHCAQHCVDADVVTSRDRQHRCVRQKLES